MHMNSVDDKRLKTSLDFAFFPEPFTCPVSYLQPQGPDVFSSQNFRKVIGAECFQSIWTSQLLEWLRICTNFNLEELEQDLVIVNFE